MGFIGRATEIEILKSAKYSRKAELGIVYGRRRVGKSSLIKKLVNEPGDLYFEGVQNLPLKRQVSHFLDQLAEQTGTMKIVGSTWKEAFDALSFQIKSGQHYVVFDELPWMASGKSDLVALIKYYWDQNWKMNQQNTLILCGSIAKFMVEHVVHSTALHNRKTFEIKLDALSAREAKGFFRPSTSLSEITKHLMVFGGIPKYLEQVDAHRSFLHNVDRLCFQKTGFFLNEFETIFKEQFRTSRSYEDIVSVVARGSLSKEALAKACRSHTGGGFSSYIRNLELADFIKVIHPVAMGGSGSKTSKVCLWDEWIKFYFTYVKSNSAKIKLNTRPGMFNQIVLKSLPVYFGLQFEVFCQKNILSILDALELSLGEVGGFGPFFKQKSMNQPGFQIDLLMNALDGTLYVLECKFSSSVVGTSIIPHIERKIHLLPEAGRYSIKKILITSAGVSSDLEKSKYFDRILDLNVFY